MTFEAHLARFSPAAWAAAVETLASEIHPIDLDATRVWLAFFPTFTSHTFLYGHRYWPQAKRAVLATAAEASYLDALPQIITKVADHASRTSSVDRDQLIGIAIVGLMTLQGCGIDNFGSGNDIVQMPMNVEARSIRQVLRRRRFQRSQGLFGILRGRKNRFRMTFDENVPGAMFDVSAGQNIASGAPHGTSLIGVLAGADRLSPIDPATEGKELEALGYAQPRSATGAPLIRLARHARPDGDVTFVIPFI